MSPNYQNNQKSKLRSFLLIASITVALIIVVIIVIGSLGTDSSNNNSTIDINATPTPYGTEVITPFYTPTPEPKVTRNPETTAPDEPTNAASTPAGLPTSTPVPIDTTKIYKKGDTGSEIRLMQQMLIAMGFDPGTADGQYGSNLEYAIEQFQLYTKLSSDGVAGSETVNAIISNYAEFEDKPLSSNPVLSGITIGIDPGHQKYENTGTESISPGSSSKAKKASDGTEGAYTDAKEYSINLQVSLKLKLELEALGANVIMTRETNDVNISNAERAKIMNNANVDCWVQIYSNGSDDSSKKGIIMLIPKEGCMNTSSLRVHGDSEVLGDALLSNAVKTTNAKNLGTQSFGSLTSFCWSENPVCLIEMGYLSNKTEDKLLVTKDYQQKIVEGLVNGFVEYFTDTTN